MITKRPRLYKGPTLSVSTGELHRLFVSRHQKIDVARILARVVSKFGGTFTPNASAYVSNVTEYPNKFSFGYSDTPPDIVIQGMPGLLITLSKKDYDDKQPWVGKKLKIRRQPDKVVVWGWETDRDMLTIGITYAECADLGVPTPYLSDTQYLYHTLGMSVCSIVNRYTRTQIREMQEVGYPYIGRTDVFSFATRYLSQPLGAIFKKPPWTWSYSRDIWKCAPNLLSGNWDVLALYYFLFLHTHVVLLSPTVYKNIHAALVRSITSFIQGEPDLLAPCAIVNLMYTGSSLIRERGYDALNACANSLTLDLLGVDINQLADNLLTNTRIGYV